MVPSAQMDLTDYLNGTKRCWTINVPPHSQIVTGPMQTQDGTDGIMIQLVRDIPEGHTPETVAKALVNVRLVEPDEADDFMDDSETPYEKTRVCTSIGLSREAAYALIMCLQQSLKDSEET